MAHGGRKRAQGSVGSLASTGTVARCASAAEAAMSRLLSPSLTLASSRGRVRDGNRTSSNQIVEKVAGGAIFHLYDPDVGIEAQLARQTLLDLSFGSFR